MKVRALRNALAVVLASGLLATLHAQEAAAGVTSAGRILGTAYDSLAHGSLAGVTVYLAGTARATTTDSAGRFRFDTLPPGRYTVAFEAPSLGSLGIDPPYGAVVLDAGATDTVALAVPSAPSILDRICPASALGDGRGMLVGAVRDADSGRPLPRATVVLTWRTWGLTAQGVREQSDTVLAPADAHGTFRVCGVPGAATIGVQARSGRSASGVIEVPIPEQGIVRRDLTLAGAAAPTPPAASTGASRTPAAPPGETSSPAGTARLAGQVRTKEGRPVAGARVTLLGGAGRTALTDSSGRFQLASLPAGTWMVDVQRIGFRPIRRAVDLRSAQTTQLALVLAEPVVVLNPVDVQGHASLLEHTGFFARKRANPGGYFYDERAIDSLATHKLSDLLRTTPGVEFVPRIQAVIRSS